MNSQILYFERTTPQMEKIFNSYMQDAVNLYNQKFIAEAIGEWDTRDGVCGAYPNYLVMSLHVKWGWMVRDN